MSVEFKDIPFECKADAAKREFEGYASTFGNVDRGRDVVVAGAFAQTIADDFPSGRIKVMWMHTDPLGVPLHMEEDSKGLFVRGRVSQTQLGNDALTLMQDRVVDRMSIGYMVEEEEERDDGVRELQRLKLMEFSPVLFPMNEQAEISGVKIMARAVETANGRKDLERLLRQSGFSRQGATMFVAKARDLSDQGEPADDDDAAMIEQMAATLKELRDGLNLETT